MNPKRMTIIWTFRKNPPIAEYIILKYKLAREQVVEILGERSIKVFDLHTTLTTIRKLENLLA